jgi:hypothetical protein
MPLSKESAQNQELQKRLGTRNQSAVFMAIAKNPLRFSDLIKVTGFPKPTLWKHLVSLQDGRFICKDTIKQGEKSGYEVGTVVYRIVPAKVEDYFRQGVEASLSFLNLVFYDERNAERMRKIVDRFIDSLVRIMKNDAELMRKELELEAMGYGEI